MKSDALTTDAPTDEHSSYISSLREEIEYLREENRAKTMIIKQLKKKKLANTSTLRTTDNFTSTYFEHPKNEKDQSPNGKKHVRGYRKEKTEKEERR